MSALTRSDLRATVARYSARRPHLARHPGIMIALRDRIRRDPDTVVIRSAIDALARIAMASAGIRETIRERLEGGAGRDDAPTVRKLMEADEKIGYGDAGILAPTFLLTPPPRFSIIPAGKKIRLVAFGDYGTAHLSDPRYKTHQAALAKVLQSFHRKHKLDFGLTTGDNFYPTSFASPDDSAWQISWARLYDKLEIPFYISLGNHDWGEPAGPLSQHIYSRTSKSWRFPSYYYTYTAGPVQFFALNTNELSARQLKWLEDELASSSAKWKIVYGHFPAYEQTDYSVTNPQRLLVPLFKKYGVDMYLCGHHHTMQHWTIDGIDYVVTGAGGAATYSLGDTTKAKPGRKFMISAPGFSVFDATESEIVLRFVNGEGKVIYEYKRTK
jgi:tartrate-resistant acid phosphatase type 5